MHRTCLFLSKWMPLFLILLLGNPIYGGTGPKIRFSETSWDFGQSKQGQSLTHIFSFENTGTAQLEIKNVRTSCGCTAALVSDEKLEPGEKGELKITLDTKGFEGNITKYIYVESNDKKNSRYQLQVSTDIDVPPKPKIELDKYSHDLGLLLEGEPIQVSTKIENRGERELHVRLSHDDALIFLNGKKAPSLIKIESRRKATIEVRLSSAAKKGMIREYILIRSNDPIRPSMSLYLTGYVISKEQLRTFIDKYKDIFDK